MEVGGVAVGAIPILGLPMIDVLAPMEHAIEAGPGAIHILGAHG